MLFRARRVRSGTSTSTTGERGRTGVVGVHTGTSLGGPASLGDAVSASTGSCAGSGCGSSSGSRRVSSSGSGSSSREGVRRLGRRRLTDGGHASPQRGEATRGESLDVGDDASSWIHSDARGVAYAAGKRVVGRSSWSTIWRVRTVGGVGRADAARSLVRCGVGTPQSRRACAIVSQPTRTHSSVYSRHRTCALCRPAASLCSAHSPSSCSTRASNSRIRACARAFA